MRKNYRKGGGHRLSELKSWDKIRVLNFLLTIYWKNWCYLVVLLHSLHYKGVEGNSMVWCWLQWSFRVLICSCKEQSIKVVLIYYVALALKVATDFISENLKGRMDWAHYDINRSHISWLKLTWKILYGSQTIEQTSTLISLYYGKKIQTDFLYPYTNLDCLET